MNAITNDTRHARDIRLTPRVPSASFAEERLHRKQQLAATFRLFSRYGFDQGLAGHVTARDPEFPDNFWINPLGRHFGQIRVSELQLVDHEGRILVGDKPINQAGFTIHSAIHLARPDVIAEWMVKPAWLIGLSPTRIRPA